MFKTKQSYKFWLSLSCIIIGAIFLFGSIGNLTQYPEDSQRQWLGWIYLVGTACVLLIFYRVKIGYYIFIAINALLAYWFIEIIEDKWVDHIAPYLVYVLIFLPFFNRFEGVGRLVRSLLNSRWLMAAIAAVPFLYTLANRIFINVTVNRARNRPHPFSTQDNFVSWRGLTDQSYSARHLGARPEYKKQVEDVDVKELLDLFKRPEGQQRLCLKSTCLFPTFAQYLTDGFIRTNPTDLKKNTSTHNIDLNLLYGRMESQTQCLRLEASKPEERGLMKFQIIKVNGVEEVFPPYLFNQRGGEKKEFEDLNPPLGLSRLEKAISDPKTPKKILPYLKKRKATLFAVGGDRVNAASHTSMMNTLLLREHNRVARILQNANPGWKSDQVFETARNVVIAEYIKIVVNDYINHISPVEFNLGADPVAAWRAKWNRPVWITTEFSLLYRWHSLIPDRIQWGERIYDAEATFLNNLPFLDVGLTQGFLDLAAQPAGELGPLNTHDGLLHVEELSIEQGRECDLAPYKEYRDEYLKAKSPLTHMEQISSDPDVKDLLYKAYGDNPQLVEFFMGIFCEDRLPNSPLPQTILTLVAIDAFSQALTNPLFSEHVFNESTFSPEGWAELNSLTSLSDLIQRNSATPNLPTMSLTRSDWQKEKLDDITSENVILNEIVQMNKKTRLKKDGSIRRAQHPKHHAGLEAEFIVREDIPNEFKVGVFEKQRRYKTFIRFSNGSKWDDRKADAHGVALKLYDVPGTPAGIILVKGEKPKKTEVDFLLVDHPVFFMKNLRENYIFHKGFTPLINLKNNLGDILGLPRRVAQAIPGLYYLFVKSRHVFKRGKAFANQVIGSPLSTIYWSATPYNFGKNMKVKYKLTPKETSALPVSGKNGLRHAIETAITESSAEFEFGIIVQNNLMTQPIEDTTVNWEELGADYIPLATLKIPVHDSETLARLLVKAEKETFSPWNTIRSHTPTGTVNRVRQKVYEAMKKMREEEN